MPTTTQTPSLDSCFPSSRVLFLLAVGAVAVMQGCASPPAESPEVRLEESTIELPSVPENLDLTVDFADATKEPDEITVQHCLIGFRGSVGGKPISRTKQEAETLAAQVFVAVKNGQDFDELIEQYTDDSPPGIYAMANSGLPANQRAKIYSRDGMVPAFGNVGFKLKVDGVGMSEFDPINSPFGWHIIKRIK